MSKETLLTPRGRVSFPHVFHPTSFDGSKEKEKYELTLLFGQDEDLSVIEDAVAAAVEKKWGKKPGKVDRPVKDAGEEEKDHLAGYEGQKFVKFSSKHRPDVVGYNPKDDVITEESERFYGGCYARVCFSAYAWEFNNKKGVSLNLDCVQKLDDGERLGGSRVKAEDAFDEVEPLDPADVF